MKLGAWRQVRDCVGAVALGGMLLIAFKLLFVGPASPQSMPRAGEPVTASAAADAAEVAPATPWRTLPAETVLERIAFGSCLDQKFPQPIWQAVLQADPQLFLMMGDNVYGDVRDGSMSELRMAYRTLLATAEFQAARAKLPFAATWDDHDYGLNDGGASFEHRAKAAALFNAFWQVTGPRAARDGNYDSVIYGPPGKRVQIILLDERSFKSPWTRKAAGVEVRGPYGPDSDPAKTMLGPAQWAWLEVEMARPAELRFVVSSMQLLADGHGFERWGNFPAEREKLLALFARTNAKGVVVLSGDRHFASIHRRSDGVPYAILDVTSSALNKPLPSTLSIDENDPQLVGAPFRPENFGMARIDWADRRLTLEIVDVQGRPARTITVAFSELGLN